MKKIFKILIPSLIFCILFFIVFFLVDDFRFFTHYGPRTNIKGELKFEEDETLKHEIDTYFSHYYNQDGKRENFKCSHAFYARDSKYAFIYLRCYEEGSGFGAHIRVELNHSNEIILFDQPIDGEDYGSSLFWLFPEEVRQRL